MFDADVCTDRRKFILGALTGVVLAVAIPVLPSRAGAQNGEPVAIAREIFEQYRAGKVPAPPWSPAVRNAMRRAEIGADPILDAQDVDVTRFAIRQVSRGSDRAEIGARFTSFGRNMVSRFDFRAVDGRWTIANYRILSGTEFKQDLRKTLKLRPLP